MRKEEKTEITKNKIFAAAMQEFGTNGYADGSINNICKTGINKGLVYHNFKDKDELYLECVRKSCEELLRYVRESRGEEGFVAYMSARTKFFREHEMEAYIFLETRTRPPRHLTKQIKMIYAELDGLNREIFQKELTRHELRDDVSEEEALNYYLEIQKVYNLDFKNELNSEMSPREQLALHERKIQKILDLMLYGIAKRR
ncbi:MAG: TetR/AcrR family transcriptional regulator [Lachnospiraceae bacterium]